MADLPVHHRPVKDPVERAARIIAFHDGWEDWHDLNFKAKEKYRTKARAVLDYFGGRTFYPSDTAGEAPEDYAREAGEELTWDEWDTIDTEVEPA